MYIPKVISSGSLKIDLMLGTGGFPLGQFIEIYGDTSVGKSSLILSSIRDYGEVSLYIDTERKFDLNYAKEMGIGSDQIVLLQDSNVLSIVDSIRELIGSGIRYVAVDSIECITNGDETKHSQAVYQFFSELSQLLNGEVCLVISNQIRMDFKAMSLIAPGGPARSFYPAIVLELSHAQTIRDKNQAFTGYKIRVDAKKNRFGRTGSSELEIYYNQGTNNDIELVDLATEKGIIKLHGRWYYYNDMCLGEGRKAASEYLASIPLKDTILNQVIERGIVI